jgi:cytidine deaminase
LTTSTLDPGTAERLLAAARAARAHAYAGYSGFPVGAALLTENGDLVTGCNVENAAYSVTICAERVAVFKAVSSGVSSFRAIAVVGRDDDVPCPPCGSCRQVLYEFSPTMLVITPGRDGPAVAALDTLLPGAFEPRMLRGRE